MKKRTNDISFILSTKGKVPSVNSIYKAKLVFKYGRPIPTLYKDSSALKVVSEINEQMKMINFHEVAPWIFKKGTNFSLTISFILKENLGKRDLDNFNKCVIDAIFRHLGLNDAKVIHLNTYKELLPEAKEEKICVNLAESHRSTMFRSTLAYTKPESIHLFGEVDDKWKSTIEKMGITLESDPSQAQAHFFYFDPNHEISFEESLYVLRSVRIARDIDGWVYVIGGKMTEDRQRLFDEIRSIGNGKKEIIVVDEEIKTLGKLKELLKVGKLTTPSDN